MNNGWMRYLLAAILVLLAGALWALAGETTMNVQIRNEGGEQITIDVNGIEETVTLDDLAEGEQRTFDVGGHEVTVQRLNDSLMLIHEGGVMGEAAAFEGAGGNMVWVTEGDEVGDGSHKVIVMKRGDGTISDADGKAMFLGDGGPCDHDVLIFKSENGEIDMEALKEKFGDDFEQIDTTDGHRILTWVGEGDPDHPIIVKAGGEAFVGSDVVVFRCEETGSTLTVKKDEHLLDTYLDPVTGCVMKKMDAPVKKVYRVEVITKDDESDD